MPLQNIADLGITMNVKPSEDVPKTVGELRRRLAKMGNPWEVDPRLGDDDPLPDPPRGGQLDEEIPDEDRLKALESEADLRGLIATSPPANPFLRARWAEAGILTQNEVERVPEEHSRQGQEDTA
jgi:hypothetical protein